MMVIGPPVNRSKACLTDKGDKNLNGDQNAQLQGKPYEVCWTSQTLTKTMVFQ